MKRVFKRFSPALLLLLLLPCSLFAQHNNDYDNDGDHNKKYEFVKKKSFNKSYNVSSADKLSIQNSFGSVEVHTWTKNEIKVEVNMEVSATTESLAKNIFDKISVSDQQNGKEIIFKTVLDEMNNNNTKAGKSSMRIDYIISMPESNPLKIKNEFGSIKLPDYKGEVELTSKFGSLEAGNLSAVKDLQVEFGSAKLGNISGGPLSIKYSSATISKLGGTIKMNIEFCGKIKLNLDNNLAGLDLKASYSTVNLVPLADMAASYTISTSFGSFKNRSAIKFNKEDDDDDHGPTFDHKYEGRSGNGNVTVKVKTNFSTIILGEASEEEMKDNDDKHKNKDKHKTNSKEVEI